MNVLVVTAPLRDATGEVVQVMEMSTDITEIRNVQSQLEALGMLVGRIAHEIKGVLTGLDGGVYMVSTGMQKQDRSRLEQGWEMVRRNVANVRTLVLDILYYAKDREPQYKLSSPIRLAEEGFVVYPHLAEMFARRGDRLLSDPEARRIFTRDGVPPAAGDRLVQTDLGATLRRIAAEANRQAPERSPPD